jgi:hypothetical protein
MPAYVYGKDLIFYLHAFEDKTKITTLPAQTVQGYLFLDQPTRAAAAAGTGALQSTTQTLAANGTIALPLTPITDPNPNDILGYRLHWMAVNFILKTAGAVQTVIKAIKVERVSGQDAEIGVTYSKVVEIYPDVVNYLTESEVNAMITLAKADLLDDLTNKGFDWNQVNKPDQLFNALLFNTLVYVYNSQIQREGDRFYVSSAKAQQRYDSLKSNLRLEYDSTMSGMTTDLEPTGGIIFLDR